MCIVVHWGRRCGRELVLGDGIGYGLLDDDSFDVEFDLLHGHRGSRGSGDDGERGSEANGRRRVGVGQDVLEGLKGEIDEGFGLLAEVESPVVLGVCEGVLEGD